MPPTVTGLEKSGPDRVRTFTYGQEYPPLEDPAFLAGLSSKPSPSGPVQEIPHTGVGTI